MEVWWKYLKEQIVNSALEDAICHTRELGMRVKNGSWNKVSVSKKQKKMKGKKKQKGENLTQETLANKKRSTTESTTDASSGQGSDEEANEEDEEYIDNEQAVINEDNDHGLALGTIDDEIVGSDRGSDTSYDVFEISLLKNAGESLLLKD